MPRKFDKYNTRSQKKKKSKDSDSDEEDEENVYLEYYDSDEELDSEDSDSDSDYKPKNNKKKLAKKESLYDEDDDDDDDDDEDDDDEDDEEYDEDDEEESNIDPRELRKTIATLFPSNYINKKVKQDEKDKKKEKEKTKLKANGKTKEKTKEKEKVKEIKSKKNTNKMQQTMNSKRSKRREEESSEEEESESEWESDEDDEEYYEDDDEEMNDEDIQKMSANILFSAFGGGEDPQELEDKKAIEEDNDDCNSDDEKTFMRENYENIPIPEAVQKKRDREEKRKQKQKHNKTEKSESSDCVDVETEYKDLVNLRKDLSEKLEKQPKNKILLKAVENCTNSIRKLVKKNRLKNAKKYYKMIKGEDEKQTGEIEYFKKQLSNKEQLRVIKELKEINEHTSIKKPYRLTLLDSNIPAKFKATVMQKVNMLRSMEVGDPEYFKLKTWVDGFMRIPFGVHKNLNVNIKDGIEKCSEFMEQAKNTLDKCVYGLDSAKMQIMQMIGQWITNPEALGSAIAIKGPPGTGKTSLVKEGISKILGREFAFIALGGTGDASFLEGHGYTYEGSLWGRIVQILMESRCMNPVIYFDELDKVSDTPRGEEIIGILTHLTDTSQNSEYHDKYFSEIHFDLSKCLFIFSYNDESRVNPILRDRMYRIMTNGYDCKEKMVISKDFLLPKIRQQVAFKDEDIIIPDDTLRELISSDSFTNGEQGVRNLKRCLEIIHTKLNLFRLMKPEHNIFKKKLDLEVTFPVTVTMEHVKKLIEYEPPNTSLFGLYV